MKKKKNLSNTTKYRVRKLLFIAQVRASDEGDAKRKARHYMFDNDIDMRLTVSCFQINVTPSPQDNSLFVCYVFDIYFPEHLGFANSVRHMLRMLNAATFNIGIAPEVVEIE